MLVMNAVINGKELRYHLNTGEIFMRHGTIKGHPWMVKTPAIDANGYLRIYIGNKHYLHHRIIYKFWNPDWDIEDSSIKNNSIDHINGHTDDNRIANLRCGTHQKNHFNETRAKGYCWHKQSNKWRAYINLNNKQIHLGLFVLEADARNAYLEAKKLYHII